ncbi:ABC-type nitrate/sulfonate/bicarbonate transport system, permease component [Gottschalkia purinilytica]|uniref:ABC-type nitrate/sulfonate/bicarbonate transport system, permease component n=1 Tax=Gottschalkia purinilytica TaxID=1503 RepID=A0A0L0W978_GOTPU|nr:ABC transporter permease subunit [Gottschalkia purinilytica]KNF08113.1 ABC-type nitrate/sulfonate/bicarbonate transport system, permease component [Gottschalkia purinilytica]
MFKWIKNYWGTIIILLTIIVVYELITDIGQVLEPVLFPGLSKIIPALIKSLPELRNGLISSLGLLIPSYALALILGISLGVTIGWYEPLRKNFSPIFHGLSPIPPTLYIPYAITILPTFWLSSAFIIFIGSFWPILNGTIHGVRLIEDKYLDNARALGLKGIKLLRKIVLPAALPMIFSGAGTALVFSFVLLTVAEMFGAKSGLGHFIQYYADFSEYDKVLAGLIAMSFVIILIMSCYELLKKKMLYWTSKR